MNVSQYVRRIPPSAWWWIALGGIVLLGLGLRCVYFQASPILSRDSIFYVWLADRKISAEPNSVPLLLVPLLRSGSWFGMTTVQWGLTLSLLCGVGLVAEAGVLTRWMFHSAAAGIVTALLFAVNPQLIQQSTQIQKESLFLFILCGALLSALAAVRGEHRIWLWWGWAGILTVFATGVRHEGVEFVLYLALLAIFAAWKRPDWKRRLKMAAGFPVGIVVGAVLLSCASDTLWRLWCRFY